ncbi:MAG: 4a-hydroxytetrahydrobiopterin dehydratase [Verrucomicrobia bacterium]|nr:4a-hydroxytetrahydrobiopterin dehydratase [Verrucomicrobiota bacterium]MCH8511952.1 4a-hydroxytetrahydrobiopterin dehydratase [Kiritimatiellia bacterium]
MTNSIFEGKCEPCAKGEGLLDPEQISGALRELEGWAHGDDGNCIVREFSFKNFYRTMAFVNAVAWIANTQDHHPDLEVGYGNCKVTFTTHKAGGLTKNDFICAAAVNRLIAEAD